jgi:protein-tyrosine kinase
MEKIQSAIAKARAERATLVKPAPRTDAAVARPENAAAAQSPATAPVGAADRAAAWAALRPLTVNPVQLERNRIVAAKGGRDAVEFDVMRTRLLQQMRINNWTRVAITSPGPGCGKSTIALNLAMSLARQAETKAILAEVDLRRPSLAAMLGISEAQGFADVLEGRALFADVALRYGQNLAIATTPTAWRNPAELLQRSTIPTILTQIEADYAPDITIFDMPPMLVSDDAMAFMGQVDCVMLVAAAETTTIKDVDVCEREIAAQTNVLGVVLNKCRYMGPDYGDGYYG